MSFPQLANIDKRIWDRMTERAGNNELMSKTQSWVRVTSTLGNYLTLESLPQRDGFAERYGDTTKSGRVGVDKNNKSIYAYNEDGTENSINQEIQERAFRPSPIISSLEVSQGNEGLSKKVNFTITAYTKGQANAIIEHFLEPGVHCLVEFGFNESQSVRQKCDLSGDICNVIKYKNIAWVQQKRRNSNGTYDAMLGIISGGNTNFGDGESYNIEVECTSIGELPAYLQHHKNLQTTDLSSLKMSSKRFNPEEFEPDSDSDETPSGEEIGKALFKQMYNELPGHKRIGKVKNLINEPWATNPANFVNIDRELRKELTENVKKGALALTSKENKEKLQNEITANESTQLALAKDGEEAAPIQKVPNDDIRGDNVFSSTIKGKIPSDQPLFSDRRYIRVALAFTIMEMQPNTTNTIPIICEDGQTVSPLYINWQDTICSAHKHMYSIDSNTLLIPNKHHPRFRIEGAFLKPQKVKNENGEDEIVGFSNPIPNLLIKGQDGKVQFNDKNGGAITDMHPDSHKMSPEKYSHFPSNEELVVNDQNDSDASFEVMEADPHTWGYLRNLYIDFDFFINTINQTGYLTKDVMYTLLNGLSNGVNKMWEFQIVEKQSIDYNNSKKTNGNQNDPFYQWYIKNNRGCTENTAPAPGQEELHIVDLRFFGKTSVVPKFGVAQFQSRGTKSPFLSANLKFDIPASMKGQVIGQRKKNSNMDNPNQEQTVKNYKANNKDEKGLFSKLIDALAEKIYAFQKDEEERDVEYNKQKQELIDKGQIQSDEDYNKKVEDEDLGWWGRRWENVKSGYKATKEFIGVEEEDVKEVRNANYELVLNNATVVPGTQNRKDNTDLITGTFDLNDDNNTTLDKIAKVISWKDTELLKTIRKWDEMIQWAKDGSPMNDVPLPIEFDFEVPGVSGFKLGDTFAITDLPKYNTKFFQVVEVGHTIEQSIWKTKIRAKLRNQEADLDGELKYYEDKIN